MRVIGIMGAAALLVLANPAMADEIYLGASAHAVDMPTSLRTDEDGADIQGGYRTKPIEGLSAIGSPSAYIHAQVSLDGDTSVAAAGLSWKIGKTLYLRPGIGLAVHDDKIKDYASDGRRIDLGSRILFEPEVAVGYAVSENIALEASWVHISHATLFSGQNPGMDFIGGRLVFSLD